MAADDLLDAFGVAHLLGRGHNKAYGLFRARWAVALSDRLTTKSRLIPDETGKDRRRSRTPWRKGETKPFF